MQSNGARSTRRAAMQARAAGVRVVAVDEGGLSAAADVSLSVASIETIVAAARSEQRLDLPVVRREVVSERILELYREAGRP